MTPLLASLLAHAPFDAAEARSLVRIRAHVEAGGDLFDRTRSDGHLTGSAFVLDAGRAHLLLIFHRKLGRWLQPGGHGEPGETEPLAVAAREAVEESGMEGLTLCPGAPAPFDFDVHTIPERPGEPCHEHLDVRFLFTAPEGAVLRPDLAEVSGAQWVTLEQAAGPDMDASVARAARKILALGAVVGPGGAARER